MAKRRRVVKVDFSPKKAFHEPPADPREDATRACWIIHGSMGFAFREVLSPKRSVRRAMIERIKHEFRALGDKIIALDKEID